MQSLIFSPRITLRIYLHEIEMLLYKKQSILSSFFAFENAGELADALEVATEQHKSRQM